MKIFIAIFLLLLASPVLGREWNARMEADGLFEYSYTQSELNKTEKLMQFETVDLGSLDDDYNDEIYIATFFDINAEKLFEKIFVQMSDGGDTYTIYESDRIYSMVVGYDLGDVLFIDLSNGSELQIDFNNEYNSFISEHR